jgi:hypothetical protein
MKTCALFLLLISAFSYGQEHLEPEVSVFSDDVLHDYHRMVVDGFEEAFERNVLARVIVIPTFFPEYAIALKEDSGTYRLFRLAPEESYWGVYYSSEYGSDRRDANSHREPKIAVKSCEREITSDLASSILEVWEAMLLKTRHRKSEEIGLDGVTYHFAGRFNFQLFSGQIWSPGPDTPPGKLVELAKTMNAWCENGTSSNVESLERAVTALAREVN